MSVHYNVLLHYKVICHGDTENLSEVIEYGNIVIIFKIIKFKF